MDQQMVVILEEKPELLALAVDAVVGIQRVVLKELAGLSVRGDLYSAAAILGDGAVAMVLNVDALRMNG